MTVYTYVMIYYFLTAFKALIKAWDAVLKADKKAIINALKEPSFNIRKDIKHLLNTITLSTAKHKQREEAEVIKKKLEEDRKLENRERLKKKKKKTDSDDSKDVKAAQTISEVTAIMPTFCNLINHSICKYESSGKYSIALVADLRVNQK